MRLLLPLLITCHAHFRPFNTAIGHNKLSTDVDDLEDDQLYKLLLAKQKGTRGRIQQAKTALIKELALSHGDVSTPSFNAALNELTKLYDGTQFDARIKTRRDNLKSHLGGMWMALVRCRWLLALHSCVSLYNSLIFFF